MRSRTKYFCLVVSLVLGPPANAEQWFSVSGPGAAADGTRVEVDLDSVRARGQGGESVIQVTFDALQPHRAGFRFRSIIATAQFDCQRRIISLTSAAYYDGPAGKGLRLGADSSGKQAGMPPALLDSIPATALRALVKATCTTS
jgi:hypothetical protein